MLTIGGGSRGLNGNFGEAGSGYMRSGEFWVNAREAIVVIVGGGGEGSSYKYNDLLLNSNTGSTSSFG